MADWYTRQEVADLLNVSKQTVYHYGKQGKIIKIHDKHRTVREVRYEKEGVDALIEQKKQQKITGTTVSELAKRLDTTTRKIYDLISENKLEIETVRIGDERYIYSLNNEQVEIIELSYRESKPDRAVKSEFYNSSFDIAIHQRFILDEQKEVRVMKGEDGVWGFYLPSHNFISYKEAVKKYSIEAAYTIHQNLISARSGYTDFVLSKRSPKTFYLIDTLYEMCGVENIRLRDDSQHIKISVKSSNYDAIDVPPLYMVDKAYIKKATVSGALIREEGKWNFISGVTRTSFSLKNELLDMLYKIAEEEGTTMDQLVEKAIEDKYIVK